MIFQSRENTQLERPFENLTASSKSQEIDPDQGRAEGELIFDSGQLFQLALRLRRNFTQYPDGLPPSELLIREERDR